jgi:hypothetical protein
MIENNIALEKSNAYDITRIVHTVELTGELAPQRLHL